MCVRVGLFACGLFLNAAMNSAKQNAAKKAAATAAAAAAGWVVPLVLPHRSVSVAGNVARSVDKVCTEPTACLADPKAPSPLCALYCCRLIPIFKKRLPNVPVCLPTDAGRRSWAGQDRSGRSNG